MSIPTRGSDTGTWDVPVNGDFSSLDGYLGGVQTISLSNAPVTLTAPAGTPTATGGPTQAQNAVLSFTGALTNNVQITLPLPGYYIISNGTTGNFVVTFRAAGSGGIIAVDKGEVQHIFNDGNNVNFANLGRIGTVEIWAGLSSMPAWVNACSKAPYLLCDGTIYNFSSFPALGARLVNWFGGNGVTTFGVPDLRGRVPLPFDSTTTRITTAGSGLNGQVLGSTLDQQTITLITSQMPLHTHPNTISVTDPGHAHGLPVDPGVGSGATFAQSGADVGSNFTNPAQTGINVAITNVSQGGGGAHANVQPSQVTGIAVIRAA